MIQSGVFGTATDKSDSQLGQFGPGVVSESEARCLHDLSSTMPTTNVKLVIIGSSGVGKVQNLLFFYVVYYLLLLGRHL